MACFFFVFERGKKKIFKFAIKNTISTIMSSYGNNKNNVKNTTFSLDITLGYDANNKTESQLNRACDGNQRQDRFFVSSCSDVRLFVKPSETEPYIIAVFVPPHMIATSLESHLLSSHVASGSSFWINSPTSINFTRDLLAKIHPTALSGCSILGIILTSIAANNGPAEVILLEFSKGTSIQKDILQPTCGDVIGRSCNVLKVLPITSVKFNLGSDDDGKANYVKSKMNQFDVSKRYFKNSSRSDMLPQIPACPVCLHRIDPIRLGLPGPCVQDLCSRFCPSPSLIGNQDSEEETCPKQRLLVR